MGFLAENYHRTDILYELTRTRVRIKERRGKERKEYTLR